MICKKCSHEVTGDVSFCPNCGARMVEDDVFERPIKEDTYQPRRQVGYSKYIFVVSLILMIILVINVVTGFDSIGTVNKLLLENAGSLSEFQVGLFDKMIGFMYGEVSFICVNFALTLTLMIVASIIMSKSKQYDGPSLGILKTQFIVSIIAASLSVAYVIYEIVVLNQLGIIVEQLAVELSVSYVSLIGPIAFAGLLMPCIFKSYNLLKDY